MCGACGSTADRHWSAPFLATLPARSSAARVVTAIAARAGSRVGVTAAAGGYAVTTPTGRCVVAADLGEAWARVRQLGVLDESVPPVPPARIASAGPASVPPVPAPVRHGAPARPVAARRLRCAAPASWRYRLPAVLAWLAVVDGRGPRRLALRLGLTPQADAAIDVVDGAVVRCAAIPGNDALEGLVDLDDPTGSFAEPLATLLGPEDHRLIEVGQQSPRPVELD